jgi:hypothetical protein
MTSAGSRSVSLASQQYRRVIACASLRITSLYPPPAPRSRCNAASMTWSIHKPTPSLLPSWDRAWRAPSAGGRGAGRAESCLLWTVSAGERAAPLQRPPPPRFPVLFCVADGIVRIVAQAGDDSGGRPRREINLLIGVAAGEDKRCDHDRDAEPHGRFPTHWSRPVGRSFGRCAGRSRPSRAPSPGVAISLKAPPSGEGMPAPRSSEVQIPSAPPGSPARGKPATGSSGSNARRQPAPVLRSFRETKPKQS